MHLGALDVAAVHLHRERVDAIAAAAVRSRQRAASEAG
jgi:hypothetical protein